MLVAPYLIEYQYDISGNSTAKIAYAKKITDEELSLLLQGQEINRQPDRKVDQVHSQFYADGYQLAEQDAAGYVTEFIRDAAGRIKKEIHYATPNLSVDNNFTVIRPPENKVNDALVHYFYNKLNQIGLEVDAEGYITSHFYYADGKIQTSIRHEKEVDLAWYQDSAHPPIPAVSENDQEITYSYDELRQLTTVKKSSGEIITYVYDEMNHRTASYSEDEKNLGKAEGDYFRGTESRFDGWSQRIARANPFVMREIIKNKEASDRIWMEQSQRQQHNDFGLKVSAMDAYGNTTYCYYDKNHQPILTINAKGVISETIRNAFGDVLIERQYYHYFPKDKLSLLKGGYVLDELRNELNTLQSVKDAITCYERDSRGLITKKIDPDLNVSEFKYDAFKQCIWEHLPVADKQPSLIVEHEYEQRGLEKTLTKKANEKEIKIEKSYAHYLGKETDYIDEMGGRTQSIRDRLGRVREIKKQVMRDQYIIDSKADYDAFSQPTKLTNADNESVSIAYSQKERTQTLTYPDGSKTTVCKNIFNEQVELTKGLVAQDNTLYKESFTHAPDGQIESHALGEENVTSVIYDWLGKKEVETDAFKIATRYHRDAARHLIEKVVDAAKEGVKLTTIYEPNAFGKNETIVDASSIIIKNEFTPTGKLEKSTLDSTENGINRVTKLKYNAQGKELDITQGDDNDHAITHQEQKFDEFNQLKTIVTDPDTVKKCTEFQHDAAGNVTVEIDADGHIKRIYYDLLQRKRFEISELNDNQISAIEYDYTNAGKLKSTRIYALAVDKEKIADVTTLDELSARFKPHKNDTVTLFHYDNKGRERFKTRVVYSFEKQSFEGILEEKRYDAADREINHTRFANTLDAQDYINWTTSHLEEKISSLRDPENDRKLYRWYDTASRERFTLSKNGVVTEKRYDKAGHVIAQVTYQLENPETWINKDVNNFNVDLTSQLAVSAKYFVYDRLGRLQFLVDPEQAVTRKEYDNNNNVIEVCAFKDRIPMPGNYDDLVLKLKTFIPDIKKDSITKTEYDHANQVIKTTDPLGNEDYFERDVVGNLRFHTDKEKQIWEYKFDSANRLVSEWTPETTITTVKQDATGQLVYDDIRTRIEKKTEYDLAGNTSTIIEGVGLEEARTFTSSYNAQNQLATTALTNVLVNDDQVKYDANYNERWNKLAVLPDTLLPSVTTTIIYNTQGKKVAEKNEAGSWSFYIYDACGRLIYKIKNETAVTKYTYNAFDQVETERQFETLLTTDLKQYIATGLSLEQISSHDVTSLVHVPETDKDRVTTYKYDGSGHVTEVQSGSIFYYSDGQFGEANPTTVKGYDIVGNSIYEAKLVCPTVWAEKYLWRDHCGRVIAQVDENKNFTRYELDVYGNVLKRVEYVNPLTLSLTKEIAKSLSIETLIDNVAAEQRVYEYKYDLAGQKLSETFMAAEVKKLVTGPDGSPTLTTEIKDLTKQWTYTASGQVKSIIYEDGQSEHKFYDERGIVIGETQVSRTSINEEGKEVTIIPLLIHKPNAFGQETVEKKTAMVNLTESCNSLEKNWLDVIEGETIHFSKPLTISQEEVVKAIQDKSIQAEQISLFDKRGLLKLKQNAAGHKTGFTYTPTRKIAREFQEICSWVKKDHFEREQCIDEKCFAYDRNDQVVQMTMLRDGQPEETTHTQYNTFGDFIGESENGKDWPLYRKLDTHGRPWYSNAEGGAGNCAAHLYDLRGIETLRLEATNAALSSEYNKLSELVNLDPSCVDRTETVCDLAGRVKAKRMPFWFKDKRALPTHSYEYDRWNNVTADIDSCGNRTDYSFNHRNQMTQRIQPEVKVQDEYGIAKRLRPITHYGYNERGFQVGTMDANFHTEGFILDEAGQWTVKILGDGTPIESRIINARGQVSSITDARGKRWTYYYDELDQVIELRSPSGNTTKYLYHPKGNLASVEDAAQNTTRYNYDTRDNVSGRYMPHGQLTSMIYDRNHQVNFVCNPDGSTLIWNRDYFGNPNNHKDLGDKFYDYYYDEKKRLKYQNSRGMVKRQWVNIESKVQLIQRAEKFPLLSYFPVQSEVPHQNIHNTYEYGLLKENRDESLGKVELYGYDSEGRRRSVEIKKLDGTLLNRIATDYDELNRETSTTNTHLSLTSFYATMISKTTYDAVSNRRHFLVDLDPTGYTSTSSIRRMQDLWYNYDRADRMIESGSLSEGRIHMDNNHGMKFEYANGFRVAERRRNYNGETISVALQHDDDGRLSRTDASSGVITERSFHPAGWTKRYQESIPNHNYIHTAEINGNGWQLKDTYQDEDTNAETNYSLHTELGMPRQKHTKTRYRRSKDTEDEIYMEYLGMDDWVPSTSNGRRTEDGRRSSVATAQNFYDTNGAPNAKSYSDDEPNNRNQVYFNTTNSGWIVNKLSIQRPDDASELMCHTGFYFLTNVNGDTAGGYSLKYRFWQQKNNIIHSRNGTAPLQPEISDFAIRDMNHPIGKIAATDKTAKNNPLGWNDINISMMTEMYTVKQGDTFESIAQKLGDSDLARTLAEINGLPSAQHALKPGHILRVPPVVPSQNKANNTRPYQEFVSIISGALAPYMIVPPPKVQSDHHSFLKMLGKFIALGIVVALAPELAIFMFGAGTTAATIAAGVLAAIGDAAVQGVAIHLGMQQRFSLSEVLETGISAGVGSAMGRAKDLTNLAEMGERVLAVSTAAAVTQLVEMQVGLRDKFDARAIALQASASLAASYVDAKIENSFDGNPAMSSVTSEVVDTGVSALLGKGICHTPINIQNLAAQSIGSTVGHAAGGKLASILSVNKLDADMQAENIENYQLSDPVLSKRASNGRSGSAEWTRVDNGHTDKGKPKILASKPAQNQRQHKDAVDELLSEAEKAGHGEGFSFANIASAMEKTVATAGAALLFIESPLLSAIVEGGGTILTAANLGIVAEIPTLDILGTAAMKTVGGLAGGGVLAAKLGLFGSRSRNWAEDAENIFKSGGDRLVKTLGPARISHPEEYAEIFEDLKLNYVDISFRKNQFAYGPSPMPGRPGNIVIDPDASISALRHEYGHFRDDKMLDFPGMRAYYENPSLRLATERRQYLSEIKLARTSNDYIARKELILDYLEEKTALIDRFYEKPYGHNIRMR